MFTSCNRHKASVYNVQEQPDYYQYYILNDDDGKAFVFHPDKSVDIYEGIAREHLRGVYTCHFPKVTVTITEIDSVLLPELRTVREVPTAYEYPLWFNENADTLCCNTEMGVLKLPASNWFSLFLFRMGL